MGLRLPMRKLALTLIVAGWFGCSAQSPVPPDEAEDQVDARSAPAIPEVYPTIDRLHEQGVALTCALNGGVCHNSKEYPALQTVSTLIETVNRPCNMNVAKKEQVHNACETKGDRLVIPWAHIDVEIKHLDIVPGDFDFTYRLGTEAFYKDSYYYGHQSEYPRARLTLASPIAAFVPPDISSQEPIEIHRGSTVFPMPGIYIASAEAQSITLGLERVPPYWAREVNRFIDDRIYPWRADMVRVADVNGDGVMGASLGISLLTPGAPEKSFLFLRLTDEQYGMMMPQVCRTWDDRSTRALACWIQGLKTDSAGKVINPYDPIDYEHCQFSAASAGHCISSQSVEGIFSRACIGCHGEQNPQAGLDLTASKLNDDLINRRSKQFPDQSLVTPGAPDSSYLFCKVSPDATCLRGTSRMPQGSPSLSTAEIEILRAWIANLDP
jgi:hypothetical protein